MYNTQETGDGPGVSMGFGLQFTSLNVDYGLATLGDFDLSHRFSLGYKF